MANDPDLAAVCFHIDFNLSTLTCPASDDVHRCSCPWSMLVADAETMVEYLEKQQEVKRADPEYQKQQEAKRREAERHEKEARRKRDKQSGRNDAGADADVLADVQGMCRTCLMACVL